MLSHGKNIVICCDGTGQTIPAAESRDRRNQSNPGRSNVLRLFDLLVKDTPHQICWYDPGIGTIPNLEREQRLMHAMRNARDEWLGLGLMENVSQAYLHLMEHFAPGDRVFLFGFSRGAFTVRALAGMIRSIGLLRNEHRNLLANARDVFENMERRHRKSGLRDHEANDELAEALRRFSRPGEIRIAFLGVWDTVKAYGYFTPRGFPFTRNNERVEVVRHAVALDERRSPFQVTGWSDRVVRTQGLKQDIAEVWFTGDHSNIGGGHHGEDLRARVAFDWMLGEATACNVLVDLARYKDATGWDPKGTVPPDATVNDLSRGFRFRLADVLPRRELNNTHFPSARAWTFMKSTGDRKPLNHKFPDDAVTSPDGASLCRAVRLHNSVHDRYRSGNKLTPGLRDLAQTVSAAEAAAKSTGTPPTLAIEWMPTRAPRDWKEVLPAYSDLNASIGSIDVARKAGT